MQHLHSHPSRLPALVAAFVELVGDGVEPDGLLPPAVRVEVGPVVVAVTAPGAQAKIVTGAAATVYPVRGSVQYEA